MPGWKPKAAYQEIYWSDFLSSTMTMSDDGAHAYLFLLGRAWEDGGYLKDDDRFLCRAARMSPRRWAKCRDEVLDRFEKANDGRFYNNRLIEDLHKVNQKREIAKQNAETRWSKKSNENNEPGYADASARQCSSASASAIDSESDPNDRVITTDSESRSSLSSSGDDGRAADPPDDSDLKKLDVVNGGLPDPKPPDIAGQAFQIWNEEIGEALPVPKTLTAERRRKIERIVGQTFCGHIDLWRQFCAKIRASAHLTGSGPRGWKASIDWCLEPENMIKILEGNYDDHRPNGSGVTAGAGPRQRGGVIAAGEATKEFFRTRANGR